MKCSFVSLPTAPLVFHVFFVTLLLPNDLTPLPVQLTPHLLCSSTAVSALHSLPGSPVPGQETVDANLQKLTQLVNKESNLIEKVHPLFLFLTFVLFSPPLVSALPPRRLVLHAPEVFHVYRRGVVLYSVLFWHRVPSLDVHSSQLCCTDG